MGCQGLPDSVPATRPLAPPPPARVPVPAAPQVAAFTGTAAVEAACQQWLAWLDAAPAAVESALELRQAPQPAAAGGQPQLMVLNTAFAQTPEVDDAYGGVRGARVMRVHGLHQLARC